MRRDEYIACIHGPGDKSLCGRPLILEWAFTSLEHAQQTAAKGSRLVACPECLQTVTAPAATG